MSSISGCSKKREAVELHAFPQGNPNIAKYLHQLSFAHSRCPLPYILTGNSHWSYPSCLCDCQGKFCCQISCLFTCCHLVSPFCANISSAISPLLSCIQAGIALGELTSLSDLYDTQSIALLFLIGVVSVTPALLGKGEAQEKPSEMAVGAS